MTTNQFTLKITSLFIKLFLLTLIIFGLSYIPPYPYNYLSIVPYNMIGFNLLPVILLKFIDYP